MKVGSKEEKKGRRKGSITNKKVKMNKEWRKEKRKQGRTRMFEQSGINKDGKDNER